MAKCPNCGLSTVRTKDWACQWCGYPLVSGLFGKTSKTLDELRSERLGETTGTALMIESEADVAELESSHNNGSGATVKPESEQAQNIIPENEVIEPATEEAPVPEAVVEQTPEPQASSEVKSEPEAVTEQKSAEVDETAQEVSGEVEPVPEATVPEEEPVLVETGGQVLDESPEQIPEVTVRELCDMYQGYGMAGHEKFKSRVFRVNGLINSLLIKEVVGQYRIAMTDPNPHPLGDVYCKFEQKDVPVLNNLKVGQEITVQGKYDGFVTNIMLRDCVLVS